MPNMTPIQPKNATQALRYARTAERAVQIIKDGYTFTQDADSEVIAVCKPGELHASYWINMLTPGCDCPDFAKHKDYCKHTIASEIKQDEEEMMEALCAEWEARQLQEA